MGKFLLFLACCFLLKSSFSQSIVSSIVYVDSSVTTSGNGASWSNAVKTLRTALIAANTTQSIKEIWVRKGTYYPTDDNDRDSSFRILRNNIKLYGGFSGTETSISQRNILGNITTLSGDLNIPNDTADNSYHVITILALSNSIIDSNTVIDGFRIEGGNASTGESQFNIQRLNLKRSVGGGIVNAGNGGGYQCSPIIRSCTFINNYAYGGAAIYNLSNGNLATSISIVSPMILNSVFTRNTAGTGSAIYNESFNYGQCNPILINSIFVDNVSRSEATIYFDAFMASDYPVITNCLFYRNTARSNAAIACFVRFGGIYITLSNSLVWRNKALQNNDSTSSSAAIQSCYILKPSYNLIQGSAYQSSTSVWADPVFVNADNPAGNDGLFGTIDDGLQPLEASQTINGGNNDSINRYNITQDILGRPRIQSGRVDVGPYETAFTTLPIKFTSAKASELNSKILVEWEVATESNLVSYDIEKSDNAINFSKVATQVAKYGNNLSAKYSWSDLAPYSGKNFYRIKATELSGEEKYSPIAFINMNSTKSTFTTYPNPLNDKILAIQFQNKKKETYFLELFNQVGQKIFSKRINHAGGSSTHALALDSKPASGIYQLVITATTEKTLIRVVVK